MVDGAQALLPHEVVELGEQLAAIAAAVGRPMNRLSVAFLPTGRERRARCVEHDPHADGQDDDRRSPHPPTSRS